MTIIDDFYREKEIINLIQAWQPNILTPVINSGTGVVEIALRSGIKERLTKDEIYHLLLIIEDLLLPICKDDGDLSRKLMKRLHENLKELKEQVRKDFDLEEVK